MPKKQKTKEAKSRDFSKLIAQIQDEYKVGLDFIHPKIDELELRLKVYSNQKRDKTAIGDPLLFTIFQTVLASLYNDRLAVNFEGREDGDEETAENLNSLSEFDYDQMQKSITDYYWDWNTLFFGRALLLNIEFDRDRMCPLPEVVDMMTWIRDPRARSVNGDARGRGAMRYGGREIILYKSDIKDNDLYFNIDKLKPQGQDPQSLLDQAERGRLAAQGYNEANTAARTITSGDNTEIRALEWFTHYKGKKVLVTLTNDRKEVIRYTELTGSDDKPAKTWPIVDRVCYPMAQDWDGVSIPDLIEDKQRARSVVQNAALKGIKSGQEPVYLYDANKIKKRGSLDIAFNKHVPIDGSPAGAVQIIDRQQVKSEVDWILNVLNQAAQSSTASPDTRQGGGGSDQTATEATLEAQGVDVRYSLTAKIWGWSERDFWLQWYCLYKKHFEADIDEKTMRVAGALGPKWRKLTRENIVASADPDVFIESKAISEAANINKLQKYRLFLKDIMATDPRAANVRFALRKIGVMSGFKKDEVDQVLPPTYDEMDATEENEMLDKGMKVKVEVTDDDFVHLVLHNKAADTPAKKAHMRAHQKALMLKRSKPELDMSQRPTEQVEEANMGAPMELPPQLPTGVPRQS